MSFAQNFETIKQEREARRAAREQAFEAQLMKAVADKNFTFIAQSMQPAIGLNTMLNPTSSYITVYPKFMDVILPSQSLNMNYISPLDLDLYVQQYSYNYNISNGYIYLQISFQNALGEKPMVYSNNFTYMFHFTINVATGNTTLTVIPNYSAPIIYSGSIQFSIPTK